MKKIIYFVLIFSYSLVHGQKNSLKVGDNPFTINSKAALEIESISKGFLPPRMNSTQRDNIATPPVGLTLYNTDNKTLEVYDGASYRGTTAKCFIFSDNVNIPLSSKASNLQFNNIPLVNDSGVFSGYNEFGSNMNTITGVFTVPYDGFYTVSIAYQFQLANWDLGETCYTLFTVNGNPQYIIYNNILSGNRIISYNNTMTVKLNKNDVFAPGISWFKPNNSITDKIINYLSFSIVKL